MSSGCGEVGSFELDLHSGKLTMENGHFEDVFPVEHGEIPASYFSLLEGTE